MAKTAAATEAAIYCRKCSYDLRGQERHRCPECGRAYDPANPKTFRPRPRGRLREWGRRLATTALVLLIVSAGPFAWVYYGWREERPAVLAMCELRANVYFRPLGPSVFGQKLNRDGGLLDRVEEIYGPLRTLKDSDLVVLSHCRGLVVLDTPNSVASDKGIESICGIEKLKTLALSGRQITDESAGKLGKCPQLRHLGLYGTSLTDSGLATLCRSSELCVLGIDSSAITDVGLAPLAGLSKLEDLRVSSPLIGDDGLATLSRLHQLRVLRVYADRYTPAGEQRLRQALPNCWIALRPYSPLRATTPSTAPLR